jgi:superfamily II DNA or RNA helicase
MPRALLFPTSSSSLRRFEPYVSARTRARGLSYAASGRVSLGDANHAWLSAVVRGTNRYEVELAREGSQLLVSCSCPYFDDGSEACKHVWATLVVAEAEGALPWLKDARSLVCSAPLLDDLDDDLDDLDDDEHEEGDRDDTGRRRLAVHSTPRSVPRDPPGPPLWLQILSLSPPPPSTDRAKAELRYVIDTAQSRSRGCLCVLLFRRASKASSKAGGQEWRPATASHPLRDFAGPEDAFVLAELEATDTAPGYAYSYYAGRSKFDVRGEDARHVVERLCALGRLHVDAVESPPVRWDALPYSVAVEVAACKKADGSRADFELQAFLERGDEHLPATDPRLVLASGLLLWPERAAAADAACAPWVVQHRVHGHVRIRGDEVDAFLEAAHARPAGPRIRMPPELSLPEASVEGKPYVRFVNLRGSWEAGIGAEAGVDYDGTLARLHRPGRSVLDRDRRRVVVRDPTLEGSALDQLRAAGLRPAGASPYRAALLSYAARSEQPTASGDLAYRIATGRLEPAARDLVAAGWRVEVDGKLRRRADDFRVEVTSGIDWLDVSVKARFGGVEAGLPELLAALRHKRAAVTLADGSTGHLPDAWIDRLRRWASLAPPEAARGTGATAEALRFARSQASVVGALVDDEELATVDTAFARLRASIDSFSGVKALPAPRSFQGTLRDYQRYAQGWFAALRRLGLGGCLADDMGLGKTVQVLAMLERRRRERPAPGPSLVVAPRSVVSNWADEAARFTPGMRVLAHVGADRLPPGDHMSGSDLVLVTYGVLRKDARALSEVAFDYVILDEAQAIKTAGTETAKAARLLRSAHRLALTGTPIENHLGELGSLLDFLNPGILGAGGMAALGSASRRVDAATLGVVTRAVRPFLLRRTKSEVAKELPDRIEQTLVCELQGEQRRLYDELHAHYRASIAARVRRDGLARSTVHILEALLRLRQAACHPGLIDEGRAREPSAKLEALVERLSEVRERGRKALVFSQFTSFLGIVRQRLDERAISYEYLDGKTRDRAARVARFQSDAGCGVFLVSLKAGGLGLNLTAAEYVFLLDPWWNPAVEAQAIDRAHRIGQTRQVIAYRLLARGTVEDKVAELQKEKRELADALFGDSGGSLGGLTRDDLERLLA